MKVRSPALALLIGAGLIGLASLATQAQQSTGVVATAPGVALAAETTKLTATVVGIDAATRDVTLKRKDGKVVVVNAGEQVRNFDQIRLGDTVTAEYTQAVSLELKKSGSSIREKTDRTSVARAPLGAKPAGVIGRQVTVLANVVAVDLKRKLVTLRGPQGNVVDLKVQDPSQLQNIKVGDQVEAVYSEELAIAVTTAPTATAK